MEFLRIVNRGKWEKRPESDWPKDSGLHCDALHDMRTEECNLSVYAVTNEINRQRVAVAFAATRDNIAHVDYIVFENTDLNSLGITVQYIEGNTPDKGVNGSHYDLGNLTVKRLAQLTEIVSTGEQKRITRYEIKTLLCSAVKNGLLDITKVRSPEIRRHLSPDA